MTRAGLLPQRRRIGLSPMTPIPRAAHEVGAMGVILPKLAGIRWSRDPAAIERVLAHLRSSSDQEGGADE